MRKQERIQLYEMIKDIELNKRHTNSLMKVMSPEIDRLREQITSLQEIVMEYVGRIKLLQDFLDVELIEHKDRTFMDQKPKAEYIKKVK